MAPRTQRPLRDVELDFLDSAPVRLSFSAALSSSPEAVYHALAVDTEGWSRWFAAVVSATPTPIGRDVVLSGGVRFEETVLAADEPSRYAYRADTMNGPGVRALLEEWRVVPAPGAGGGSVLRWRIAADGPLVTRVALRLISPGLRRAFHGAARALDRGITA
ncbi:SRPBCC family protein [Streptomyces sp. NPDC051976]|uniref:SRPBCC family protein n=1 Tax=Streptomyces sp. NPDC051976 TaxID=3154947 RepID=UPI00341D5487